MVKVIWNGVVFVESDQCEMVEGNYYFFFDSIYFQYFQFSNIYIVCGWKGIVSYYIVVVDGQENLDVVWYYFDFKFRVENIKGYIVFWWGVKVEV